MRIKPLILKMVSLFGFALIGCSSNEDLEKREIPAIPVIATLPTTQNVIVYLESIGTLQPSVLMEIRPQASGTLSEVLIKEGQVVGQGDVLFKIDPKSYQIKVREAEAQLSKDEASFKAVQKKIARYKDLAERDLIAKTEWDELKAQLLQAQASVDLGIARLESAQLDLEHCTLKSPVEGRVGKLDAHPGLLITSGQTTPLATISKMNPLIVEFTVTEKEFPLIPKNSLEAQIQSLCSSHADVCASATVTFLDNHFDEKTGLLLVRGVVKNPHYTLRPGQSIRVKLPISMTENAILIPQKAIRYNQQGPYVYTINEDMTVAVRQLILGKELGKDQIILEGLGSEEQLILDGHLRLSHGLKVDVKS